jgi:nitrate/nitrite-specific signal transduction histidine kinase
MVTIEFALLSYFNATENIYSWKLEGLEKEWNTNKSNIASYANLQPGTYTLWVKAANAYGIWSNPIKLVIKIKPPFYKTWWFLLLCILAIGGTIYYYVQQRIKRLKEKYALQNKIASDLHDEVGSTLTSINILSNISQQAMDKQPLQAKEMLQKISVQSKAIQQNISDIVWSIRPDNEKGESLFVRIREHVSQILEPLGIDITIKVEDGIGDKILTMPMRRELLLIVKEAINNIVKHAGATIVYIQVQKNNKLLVLSIKDNGLWKGSNSGTGTKTMEERAKALKGSFVITYDKGGTEVKVSIPIT